MNDTTRWRSPVAEAFVVYHRLSASYHVLTTSSYISVSSHLLK